MRTLRPWIGFMVAAALVAVTDTTATADWDPARFATEDTLELLTVSAETGEHWFPVWLVVLDGQIYVRLGSRAAGRVENNTRAPILSVRIAGEEFSAVRGEPVPEMADRVAQAMAEKYTTDLFVRYMSHPLTLRLVPVVREARDRCLAGSA